LRRARWFIEPRLRHPMQVLTTDVVIVGATVVKLASDH
jgi:hypothetical protein